ncbi:MAG TPA: Mpo1-like protein [Ktedonobacterales bacterium]
MKVPGKVPEMLRRPDKMPPVAIDGLEPLAQGSDESWGEWTRWYLSRHRSPLNRATHVAACACLVAAPVALLGRRWRLSLALSGAGLACIAIGHALEGNMPTIIAEPQRLFGKPLGSLKSGLRLRAASE